ncbi:MAG: hypothetical protein GPI96_16090 [Microcystis aeruginosa BS13-02]|jgi:hypothetical protein|nr:hypothetical protein [Microcystis aeruginosa BS13-02]
MTSIELRQKLINQIDRLSFEKLLVVEKLIESLESHLPETSKNIDSAPESPASTNTYLEDDPIIEMCSGVIPNLSERAEEILETAIKPPSGWTWKE